MDNIFTIKDLVIRFYTYEGIVNAIEEICLDMIRGETLGIIGETGCGKSVTALSILNLILPPGRVEKGEILFHGKDGPIEIFKQNIVELREIRGKEISMIFQDPTSALNPVYPIGDQIAEAILLHRGENVCKAALKELDDIGTVRWRTMKTPIFRFERFIFQKMLENPKSRLIKITSKVPILNSYRRRLEDVAKKDACHMLKEMDIADPERVVEMYPYELSGGMQQRVMIAMALACNPTLLIADEPTTSLDVTVQAQILELIKSLKERFGSSILYITHDMGIIAEICDRVAVMYAGTICEVASVIEIFKNPLHPYTKALLESIPKPGAELISIPGTIPSLIDPPTGCRFHPRCQSPQEKCSSIIPQILQIKEGHSVSCHLYRSGGQ